MVLLSRVSILLLLLLLRVELFSQTIVTNSEKAHQLNQFYENLTSQNNIPSEVRIKNAETVIKLARELNNQFILAKALIYVGKIVNRERNAEKTRKVLSEALSISKNIKNEYLEAETEISLCDFYRITINKPDSALVVAKRAYSIGQSLNDTILIRNAGLSLVLTYTSLHDPINTIRFAKTTLAYCKNDKAIQSGVYNQLAIVYGDAGDLRESIKYQELSLQIADESKSYMQMASLMNSLAGSHAQLMEFNEAIEFHKKALDIYTKVKEVFGIAYTYNLMGMTFISAKRSSEAIKNFKEAIARFTRIDSKQQLAFAQSNLATVYLNSGKIDLAGSYILGAIKNAEAIKDELAMGDAYATAGQYYRKKGMLEKSISYLEKGVRCARNINNPHMLQAVYEQLSNSYNEKGDAKNALVFLQQKNAIADTIARQNAQRAYIEMMVKYETNKTKEEISEAKNNLSKLKTESEQKDIMVWGIVIGSALLISVFLFIYWKKLSALLNRYKMISRKPFADGRNIKAVIRAIDENKSEAHQIDSNSLKTFIDRLTELVEKEKLYLNSELTLGEVAKLLSTNTAFLSKAVNQHYDMNFSNYLNKFRIEEAKRLIDEGRQDVMTFEGIANSCGFVSRSSFNQAFKKFTGMTPTEYSDMKKYSE